MKLAPPKGPKKIVYVDALESRRLLAATVTTQIPTQNMSDSQAPISLALSSYFDDSVVPAGDTVVDLQTNLPSPDTDIPIVLTNAATPQTVANFLYYVNNGEYANTVIHRSIPGFVIQGGGYNTDGNPIATNGDVMGEYATATLKNTTGTIAMALSNGPNTGTSQWFINLANNPQLDNTSDGGPFTAFGQVIYNGMTTVNAIGTLPYIDDVDVSAWTNLPVQGYNGSNGTQYTGVPASAMVTINPVVITNVLTYTVSSDNTSIATAAINNGQLTVTPVTDGIAHITVTATDLGGGTASSTFAVNVATPTQLAFSQPPANAITGETLSPVAVTVENKNDNPVTFDNSSVQLTITNGPSGATLGGTTTVATVNGVATFSDLVLSTPGEYTLTATDGSLTVASATLDVALPTTTVTTLTSTVHTLTVGQTDTLNIHVAPVSGTSPVPAGTVSLYENDDLQGTYTLDSNGNATASFTISAANANASFDAIYSGDSNYSTSTSSNVMQAILPASTTQLSLAKVSIPQNVVAGGTFNGQLSAVITNPEQATLSGNFSVVLYADATSSDLDSAAKQITTITKKLTIKDGKSATIPFKIKSLPSSLANGTYHLVAELTDPNNASALVTSSQTTTVAAAEVDLSGAFSKNPVSVKNEKKSTVTVVVTNSSSANIAANGKLPVILYAATNQNGAGETQVGSITKSINLKAGASVKINVPVTISNSDSFLIATLDPGAAVFADDTNVANNTFSVPLSVVG
ncbi:MAG TPA: peptidylprolyl isomerase [Tepidisphaeraceae bacterium]|jgi:peptidyl-prolyl cis-trans isomerase A (cyclophilin A)